MTGVLVRGAFVLTSDEPARIDDGAVRIVGERIDAVGTWAELSLAHPDDDVTGGPNDIVVPGFVNTHGHFSEGLITGIVKDATLWEWVARLIGPVAPHLDEAAAYAGTMLAAAQMLRSGITLANDMFVCDPQGGQPVTPGVVRALDEIGLRGEVSFGGADVRGCPVGVIMDEHAALAEAAASSRLSRFRVGIAAVGAQSESLWGESLRLVEASGAGSHIHLQEIREEVTATRQRFGVTPIEFCAAEGLFDSATIAAHCVWVDGKDEELLAAHGVGVAHNPVSNMILASGVCPVASLRRRGIDVGIGVDGAASNDRQDMMEAIKTTVLLQRVDRLQATAMDAVTALEMATIGGARALGLDDDFGSITVGKAADMVVFDGDDPALATTHDPFGSVVFCAGPAQIKDVWVAGSRSVASGRLTNVDVAEVVVAARPIAKRIVSAAGVA